MVRGGGVMRGVGCGAWGGVMGGVGVMHARLCEDHQHRDGPRDCVSAVLVLACAGNIVGNRNGAWKFQRDRKR